jgi:hypothetical protein
MELTGKLIKIGTTTEKNVRKFGLETPGQYVQKIEFTLFNKNCELLDRFFEGDSVKVFFDVRGKEYDGKLFNTLNCFKIENV